MTTYSELNELMITRDERYTKWENDLFHEAVSLRDMLVEKLNPPTEELKKPTIIDGQRSYVVKQRIALEMPLNDCNEVENMLLRQYNFRNFINDDGSLLFSIVFNFSGFEPDVLFSRRTFLAVRYINNQPMYEMIHRITQESFNNFISREEMIDEIVENFLKMSRFDFYQGQEKSQIGFGF